MKKRISTILAGVFLCGMMALFFGCGSTTGSFEGELISAGQNTLVVKGESDTEIFTTTNKTEYDLGDEDEITAGDTILVDYEEKGDDKIASSVTIIEAVDHSLTMEGELSDLNDTDFVVSTDSITAKFEYDAETEVKGKLNEGDEVKVTYEGNLSEEPYAEKVEVIHEQEDDPHYEAHGIIADVSDTTVLLSIDSSDSHRFLINDRTQIDSSDNKIEIGDRAEITFTGDINHDPVATKIIVHHQAKKDQYVINGTIDRAEKTYFNLNTGKNEYKILIDDKTKFTGDKYGANEKATVAYTGKLSEEPLAVKVYCSKNEKKSSKKETTKKQTQTKATETKTETKPTETETKTETQTETKSPDPPGPVTITVKGTLTKWDEENQTCQVKVDEENILDLTTANAEIPVGYFPQVEDVVQVEYDSEKMDVINMILIERPDPDPQTPPDRNESQTKQPEATQETTTKAPTTTTTTTTTKPTTTTTKATTAAPTEAPEDSGNGED